MALHEQSVGATDEWYTTAHVFEAMSCQFDLDVASPGHEVVPWIPAAQCLTHGGLERPWEGFVWMNPPFGARNGLIPWLDRFSRHAYGVALVPDRTSAPWWQTFAPRMNALLFVSPKIRFIGVDGEPGKSPAQGTTLMALGEKGVTALREATINGLGFLISTGSGDGR